MFLVRLVGVSAGRVSGLRFLDCEASLADGGSLPESISRSLLYCLYFKAVESSVPCSDFPFMFRTDFLVRFDVTPSWLLALVRLCPASLPCLEVDAQLLRLSFVIGFCLFIHRDSIVVCVCMEEKVEV